MSLQKKLATFRRQKANSDNKIEEAEAAIAEAREKLRIHREISAKKTEQIAEMESALLKVPCNGASDDKAAQKERVDQQEWLLADLVQKGQLDEETATEIQKSLRALWAPSLSEDAPVDPSPGATSFEEMDADDDFEDIDKEDEATFTVTKEDLQRMPAEDRKRIMQILEASPSKRWKATAACENSFPLHSSSSDIRASVPDGRSGQ